MTDAKAIESDSALPAAETPAIAAAELPAAATSETPAAIASEAPAAISEAPAIPVSEPPAAAVSEPSVAVLSAGPADAVSPAAAEAMAAAPASATVIWLDRLRATAARAIPENRAAVAAAGIGFVAGAGLLIGTLGVMGVGHLFAAQTTPSAPWSSITDESRALKQTVTKLETQITGLKSSIEASNRHANTQRTQITDRYEKAVRTQAEMQARLVKIGDAVERLEKRVTAVVTAEATGSVAPRYAAAVAGVQPPTAETKAPPPPLGPPVAEGWVIRDVFRGRAVVTNRRGVFEAAPGLHLPELGRVEAVTRQNGHWVVVTERGIISAMRLRPRAVYGSESD